jgi:hypothetical protein
VLEASLIPLTVAFAVVALLFVVGAVVVGRRLASTHDGFEKLTRQIDDRAAMLPIMLSTARAELAERAAAIEHGMWTVASFDRKIDAATTALSVRRRGMDDLHGRVVAGRGAAERLKSAIRMIMRAIELRRTILG